VPAFPSRASEANANWMAVVISPRTSSGGSSSCAVTDTGAAPPEGAALGLFHAPGRIIRHCPAQHRAHPRALADGGILLRAYRQIDAIT